MNHTIITLAVSALIASTIHAEELKVPLGGIGFHYDGTGIHPSEHKPPTTWDEGEGLTSTSPALCVPKGSKNVRWVAETPNWCYGLPVEVGDRVFFMCEPGAVGMRWPTLVCLDRKTGKEQWRTEINSFDAKGIQGEARKKLEEQLDEWWDGWRFQYGVLKSSMEWTEMSQVQQQAAIQKIKERWGLDYTYNSSSHAYGWTPHKNDRWKTVEQALGKVGIFQCAWHAFGAKRIGDAFPTPVSDGKAVYVLNHFGIAARVEMDGKIGWYADVGNTVPMCSSPRVYENLLLAPTWPHARALDCATGKVVWERKTERTPAENGTYVGVASGFIGRLGKTPVYFAPFGDIYRLPDGKLLLSDPLLSQQPPCWDQKNEMLFRHVHNDGFYGYKVLLEGETAKIEKKWGIPNVSKFTPDPRYLMKNCSQVHAPVSFNDRTYMAGYIYHCATGDVLSGPDWNPKGKIIDHVTGKEKKPTHEHTVQAMGTPGTVIQYLVAGDRIFGVDTATEHYNRKPYFRDLTIRAPATMQIFSLDGKKLFETILRNPPFDHPALQRVNEQGIFPNFFSYSGSFGIGQDALYVRGVTHLWCLSESK